MTLVISTLTSSGIVLTADSRQTYKNQLGATRIGSDSAMKLFKLSDSCGVAISGRAFLSEKDEPAKDVGFFINKFIETEKLDGLTTKEIAEKLNENLGGIFITKEIDSLKKQIKEEVEKDKGTELVFSDNDGNLLPFSFKDKNGKKTSQTGWVETVNMIVAGIDKDKVGRAYSVSIPKGITMEKNTQQCGALWVGQTDVLTRIVKGFAPEIENIDFVKNASEKDKDISTQLNKLEYIINWATITVQDAIDFCVLMTRTTENIQRFSDGTFLAPGGITGVGGEIDIAVITPQKGFNWLKKKNLKSEGSELSLD
ncbi:hypothetical protein IT399_02235 [Candidatus Nomurabacteria bacterium]|nr:hypothetical protein [Candidatus Nomurabacteria bacterium]